MRLYNRTPAPAMGFRQFASDGSLDCVVSVRASFVHVQDGLLAPASAPEPFHYEDVYVGDPHVTNMLRQGDLVPEKPGTDITFLGSSFAPERKPSKEWDAAIRVGVTTKRLRVTGPRHWVPQTRNGLSGLLGRKRKPALQGWTLSESSDATEVELDWTKAFGGPIMRTGDDGTPADVHSGNPLGTGLLDAAHGDPEREFPAHQLDDPNQPTTDWREHDAQPQGFGLIPPWWRQRQQYAGTYDKSWTENRHPLLPEDFDIRFWQCAHPDLIATPHLRGDEDYELINLHASHAVVRGRLPNIMLGVHCEGAEETSAGWHALALDGIHFDFRDNSDLVMLTWRTRFPLNQPERAVLTLSRIQVAEPAAMEAA